MSMRSLLAVTTLGALGVLCAAGAFAQPVVSFSSPGEPLTVPVGALFAVSVNISGLGNGKELTAYSFDLTYDNSYLKTNSVAVSDPVLGDQFDINGSEAYQDFTDGDGYERVGQGTRAGPQLALQAPAFTLTTFTFFALQPTPMTELTLDQVSLTDEHGDNLDATIFGDQFISITGPPSTLSAPEVDATSAPAALTLLVGCLLVLGRAPRPQRRAIAA